MRRALVAALVLSAAFPTATAARTTSIGIYLDEFTVGLGRDTMRKGFAKFNVSNVGEDLHDFVVRNGNGRVLGTSGELRPGERTTIYVRFKKAGRFQLVCTIADHEARGMTSKLRVKKP